VHTPKRARIETLVATLSERGVSPTLTLASCDTPGMASWNSAYGLQFVTHEILLIHPKFEKSIHSPIL
jgi:hypothetical protein